MIIIIGFSPMMIMVVVHPNPNTSQARRMAAKGAAFALDGVNGYHCYTLGYRLQPRFSLGAAGASGVRIECRLGGQVLAKLYLSSREGPLSRPVTFVIVSFYKASIIAMN